MPEQRTEHGGFGIGAGVAGADVIGDIVRQFCGDCQLRGDACRQRKAFIGQNGFFRVFIGHRAEE